MNYRQLQYAVLLAKEGNFSQLAEKLGITQPALSKQILGLEKELGVLLFDRSSMPIVPTAAGEYFVREAQELLFREDRLLRSMEQFKKGEKGNLDIGLTPFRSSYLVSKMIKQVRQKYPGVTVKLHEVGIDILRKETAEGRFDFSIINLPIDESDISVIPMEPDQLVLVIPNVFLEEYPFFAEKQEVRLRECGSLPFAVVSPTQEMRQLFEKLCRQDNFHPNIAAEVVGLTTAWQMACSGVAATLLPLQFVDREQSGEKITVKRIKDANYSRQPAIALKKGQYISDYAKYAISLLVGADKVPPF